MIVQKPTQTPHHAMGRASKVCVVDPRPADYADLLGAEPTCGMRLEFLPQGRDALHAARTGEVDVWVVNVSLPDMSGLDLCEMLKSHRSDAVVYLVTDAYEPEEERAAWRRGAAMFGAKPAQPTWFSQLASTTPAGAQA